LSHIEFITTLAPSKQSRREGIEIEMEGIAHAVYASEFEQKKSTQILTYIFLVPGNSEGPREHWFICCAVITIFIINIYKQKSSSIAR
jgi:hypothetical protein